MTVEVTPNDGTTVTSTVVAWGQNGFGQTNVPSGLSNVAAAATGADHSLALRFDGTVVAWGGNDCGQTNVPLGLNNVVAIAAGGTATVWLFALGHSLALKSDGRSSPGATMTWPKQRAVGPEQRGAISAGGYHSLALKSDGTVVAWASMRRAKPTCRRA